MGYYQAGGYYQGGGFFSKLVRKASKLVGKVAPAITLINPALGASLVGASKIGSALTKGGRIAPPPAAAFPGVGYGRARYRRRRRRRY
jgi:hypothetical protein